MREIKITKYQTFDRTTFDNLEEANQYETAAFNRWLLGQEYHPFVSNAGNRLKIENYETQSQAREGALRELFLYLESKWSMT